MHQRRSTRAVLLENVLMETSRAFRTSLTMTIPVLVLFLGIAACGQALATDIRDTATPGAVTANATAVVFTGVDAGTATPPATPFTPEPLPTGTPTAHRDFWSEYVNPVFAISLQYPGDWQPVPGYGAPDLGDIRFAAINGFFHVSAMDAGTIDIAASREAGHKLQPYGSRPTIENLVILGQEARLILPSADQPAGMSHQSALIVRYPQSVNILGSPYRYFVLWADQAHIRTIAQTLRFSVAAPAGPTVTPWPPPAPVPSVTPAAGAAVAPYCGPSEASVRLSAPVTTLAVGQVVSVTVTLANGAASDAILASIGYSLDVQPPHVLTSTHPGPERHALSLQPGEFDRAEFVLHAAVPGRATVTGSTNFEIHARDFSSAGWAGCRSWPLQFVVAPAADTHRIIAAYDDLFVRDGFAYPAMTIAVTSEGVWVGFGNHSASGVDGGVWRFDGDEWTVFTQAGGFPVSDNVQILSVAPDGSLWAGAGCQVARYAGGVWEKLADCASMKGKILDIVFTPDGAAWVASGVELSRFDGQEWTSFGKLANDLAVAPDGALWVSGWEGRQSSFYVARFDGIGWTTYRNGVGKIAVTPDGDLWGALGGRELVRFDGESWRHYTEADGLSAIGIRDLVVGPAGALWAVGYQGLAILDGDRWVVRGTTPGPAALAFDRDGTMWLGTPTGVVHLHPGDES